MTNAERRVVDSFWDLRDDAYDHPGRWEGLTAEALFQRLAECVEEAEERGGPLDWPGVAERMLAWRDDQGSASAPVDQSVVLLEPPGNWGVVHFGGRRFPALAVQGDTFSALRGSALHAQERLASDDVEGCAEELEGLVATLRDALAYYERVLRERGFNVPYGNPETARP